MHFFYIKHKIFLKRLLVFLNRKRVLLDSVRKAFSLLFPLYLQNSEMLFHCCAHTHIGAYPEDVVLIYGIVNTFGGGGIEGGGLLVRFC